MKYNKGDKYVILEGEDENLAIEVSELDLSSSRTAYPVTPIKVDLDESDENIINKIKQYAYHVGLIGLSSIRVLNISSNEIIIGNKYNNIANKQFGLDTFNQNSELFFNKEKSSVNTEKGSIYLLEKLRTGRYIDYMPSFHRKIGKTTVLLEKANQLANEGNKVLYLTRSASLYKYNKIIEKFDNSDDVVFKGIREIVNIDDFSDIIFDDITMDEYKLFLNTNNGLNKVLEKYGYMIG